MKRRPRCCDSGSHRAGVGYQTLQSRTVIPAHRTRKPINFMDVVLFLFGHKNVLLLPGWLQRDIQGQNSIFVSSSTLFLDLDRKGCETKVRAESSLKTPAEPNTGALIRAASNLETALLLFVKVAPIYALREEVPGGLDLFLSWLLLRHLLVISLRNHP